MEPEPYSSGVIGLSKYMWQSLKCRFLFLDIVGGDDNDDGDEGSRWRSSWNYHVVVRSPEPQIRNPKQRAMTHCPAMNGVKHLQRVFAVELFLF